VDLENYAGTGGRAVNSQLRNAPASGTSLAPCHPTSCRCEFRLVGSGGRPLGSSELGQKGKARVRFFSIREGAFSNSWVLPSQARGLAVRLLPAVFRGLDIQLTPRPPVCDSPGRLWTILHGFRVCSQEISGSNSGPASKLEQRSKFKNLVVKSSGGARDRLRSGWSGYWTRRHQNEAHG